MVADRSVAPPIGVGIVGLSAGGGWAADAHVPALRALDGYELRAVTGSAPESARAAAEHHGVPLAFSSVEELAADDRVDLVVVAVKVARHRELVLPALAAGKMVYCEWPLGKNLQETEELAAVADAQGLRTAVGLQVRSSPVAHYLRDLIAEGYVGDVLSTSMITAAGAWGETFSTRAAYNLDREGGNTMLAIGVGHVADVLTMCLGEFVEVDATMANRRPQVRNADTGELAPKTVEDQIAVVGVLEGGAVASLHVRGGVVPGPNLRWEINGTEGDLRITGDTGYLHLGHVTIEGGRNASEPRELPVPGRYETVPRLRGRNADPSYNVAHAYARLLADMAEGTEHVPSFAYAVRRHRALDAIERAARTGERQRSPSPGRAIPEVAA